MKIGGKIWVDMSRGPESELRQLHFNLLSEEFSLPNDIRYLSWGPEFIAIVSQRKIWVERPGGGLFVANLIGGLEGGLLVNPANWKIDKIHYRPQKKNPEKLASFTIIAPPLTPETGEKLLGDTLSRALPYLRKSSPFFLLEERGADFQKEWRTQILRELKLVHPEILTRPSDNYLVWEARVQKKPKIRIPVDLTDPSRGWKYEWVRELWLEMKKDYESNGFEILEPKNSEIVARLKSSRFVLDDIGRLKQGFGVELRADCGCHWKVSLRGDFMRTFNCETPGCRGVPELATQAENIDYKTGQRLTSGKQGEIYHLGETVLPDKVHGLCGEFYIETVSKIEDIPGGMVKIFIEDRCPHHGRVGRTRRKIVSRSQLLPPQK